MTQPFANYLSNILGRSLAQLLQPKSVAGFNMHVLTMSWASVAKIISRALLDFVETSRPLLPPLRSYCYASTLPTQGFLIDVYARCEGAMLWPGRRRLTLRRLFWSLVLLGRSIASEGLFFNERHFFNSLVLGRSIASEGRFSPSHMFL